MEPEKIILDWRGSAVERSVFWLVDQSKRKEFIDLSHLLVVTQTSWAARRIKESLGQVAKEKDSACLLPQMRTPGSLIAPDKEWIDGFSVASSVQSLAYWTLTLKEQDLGQFKDLFPQIPKELDASWVLSMARAMIRLRETLAEANYDCELVEQSGLTEKWGERDRWSDLSRLERHYRVRLERDGMMDPMDARRRWVVNPVVGTETKRVVLMGVSGFPDLFKKLLETLMKKEISLQVVVFCSNRKELDSFDTFGRPVSSAWESRPLKLSDEQLHLCYGPVEQAKLSLGLIDQVPRASEENVNIGVLDPEVKEALLESEINRPDKPVFFDPEGQAGKKTPLYCWLQAVHDLFLVGGMGEAMNLMRFPLTHNWLKSNEIDGCIRTWLEELDFLHTENLSKSPADGIFFSKRDLKSVYDPLNEMVGLIKRLKGRDFELEINDLLKGALSGGCFEKSNREEQSYLQILPMIGNWLNEIKQVSGLNPEERFSLLLKMVGQSTWRYEERENEMNLYGWLELCWADAPRLLVLGCNESYLPESLPTDTFIPQSLRRELGLWTNEDRSGRDSYLLHWLLSSHDGASRVDFIIGKFSRDESPLKPSSLFFLCHPEDEEALPDRTEKLFGEVRPESDNPPWAYPWKLNPGKHVPIRRISVTSFRAFLSCPFRFYLKQKYGMREYDSLKAEADFMDFGNLIHSALEALPRKGHEKTDSDEIYQLLKKKSADELFKRYGRNPSLPIRQQKASIERRLAQVSKLHEQDLANGWAIHRVEEKFHLDTCGSKEPAHWRVLNGEDDPLESERSIRVVGKIDRIDFHSEKKIYRLLDYKTGSKGPDDLHLRGGYAHWEEFPEYFKFELDGRSKRWIDLQLPLYQLWAEKTLLGEPGERVEVGIFNLPARIEEIGIHSWTGLNEELIERARICMVGVIEDLLDPADHCPITKVKDDDFENLFFHSPGCATNQFIQ